MSNGYTTFICEDTEQRDRGGWVVRTLHNVLSLPPIERRQYQNYSLLQGKFTLKPQGK